MRSPSPLTFPLLALFLVSACVLHTKTPLFTDGNALPLFGVHPVTFAVFDAKDGKWVANDEPMATLTPVGRHYDMADPSVYDPGKVDSYYFIPLDDQRLLVQAVTGGEADYAIATWDGKTLLASLFDCTRLKAHAKADDPVTYDGDSCALLPGDALPLTQFDKLAPRAGPPTLKFVRQ